MNKPRLIKQIVAEYYDISVGELDSKSREQNIAIPRAVAYTILRSETTLTIQGIGDRVGGRDHSTVTTMIKKAKYERKLDIEVIKNILHKHLNSLII